MGDPINRKDPSGKWGIVGTPIDPSWKATFWPEDSFGIGGDMYALCDYGLIITGFSAVPKRESCGDSLGDPADCGGGTQFGNGEQQGCPDPLPPPPPPSPCQGPGKASPKQNGIALCNAGDKFLEEWDCPVGCTLDQCVSKGSDYCETCDKKGPDYYSLCANMFGFGDTAHYCHCCQKKKK